MWIVDCGLWIGERAPNLDHFPIPPYAPYGRVSQLLRFPNPCRQAVYAHFVTEKPKTPITAPILGILIGALWLAIWSPVFLSTNPAGATAESSRWPWNQLGWLLFCYGFPVLLFIVSVITILRSRTKR